MDLAGSLGPVSPNWVALILAAWSASFAAFTVSDWHRQA